MSAKRGRVDEHEKLDLRKRLLQELSVHLDQEIDSLEAAVPISPPTPTLLELGLKSAACSALKG